MEDGDLRFYAWHRFGCLYGVGIAIR